MRTRRGWLIALGICIILAFGCWVLSQMAAGIGSSMKLMFLTTFRIENRNDFGIEVTPVGIRETTLMCMPLPRYDERKHGASKTTDHGISVPAHGSVSITYDWDDVNFRHILVKAPTGRILILDTDRKGTGNFCYAAQREVYVVPKLKKLSAAPKELTPCFYGKPVSYSGAKEYPEERR